MNKTYKLIDELYEKHDLGDEDLLYILEHLDEASKDHLIKRSQEARMGTYENKVYMRGLIEFTNYCKNGCVYCGIRAENRNVDRYRLDLKQILHCCQVGYDLGYRTFVLQGGDDPHYTDDKIVDIVTSIKTNYPDCALTLSLGEKEYDSFKRYYEAGADRYLLRHETNSRELYDRLHPRMDFDHRIKCLENLKEIGFQIGAGFMVGLPNQSMADFVKDLRFLKNLGPHMVGLGPFIPHQDTELKDCTAGTVEMTTTLLALVRLLLPEVLLPATTALGSINPKGREAGLKAGANVVMPNLSPTDVRELYSLYDGKICTGDEAAHCRKCIEGRINSAGFKVDMGRGDHVTRQ